MKLELMSEIATELEYGLAEYGQYESLHEIASVLREEYEEFWDLVKEIKTRHPIKENADVVCKELVQIAAVAMRAVLEIRARVES